MMEWGIRRKLLLTLAKSCMADQLNFPLSDMRDSASMCYRSYQCRLIDYLDIRTVN